MKDRVVDTTVRIDFQTNDADGAPVAPSSAFAASDFRIYKDGSATQKATTDGITVTSPFDSVVGDHLIEIDTSNDTGDDGFWALGSEYRIKINSAKTVDGQVQTGVKVGEFRLVSGAVALDSAAPGQIANAVWDEAMSGHTTNGTYGARVVRATNSNVEVQITGSNHVAADVHEFQAGVITAGDFASNSITAAALAADAVTEIQNGLSTLTAPQVNAEVVDALSVDTYAELTAPPAATSSLKDKITWLFMYARNKVTQTASQRKLYRDDGTTVAGTSGTSDDGTTFTKGEDA